MVILIVSIFGSRCLLSAALTTRNSNIDITVIEITIIELINFKYLI